jgi:hypothetical protein
MCKLGMKKTVAATVLAVTCGSAFSGVPSSGWTYLSAPSTSNVKFYQKNGSEVYVQVVDLFLGAKVEMKQLYTGQIRSKYNGNWYPGYKRDSVANWYNGAGNPVSVVNGDYFADTASSSTAILSFPVRSNWKLIDAGADAKNDRQIEFIPNLGVQVMSANLWRLSNPTNNIIQNAVGGYSPSKADSYGELRGRTGMCAMDANPSRYLLIFSHRKATQPQVNSDLTAWNCAVGSEIMMDGSASAQMRSTVSTVKIDGVASGDVIGRTVPQVIVIRNN